METNDNHVAVIIIVSACEHASLRACVRACVCVCVCYCISGSVSEFRKAVEKLTYHGAKYNRHFKNQSHVVKV